jgi:hypothetical protein
MNLFINRLPVDLDEAKGIVGLTIFTTFWKTKIHIKYIISIIGISNSINIADHEIMILVKLVKPLL